MKRKIDLLKAMQTFVVVVEEGSFSAASRKLNLVVSAVSRQIVDIEQHFGCQLLYRSTRAMSLTAEGQQYLVQFRSILQSIEQLEHKSTELNDQLSGHLIISAPVGAESFGFLAAADEYMQLYPQVRLSWVFVNRFVNMVEEGIDLSIRVGDLPDSSFIARRYAKVKVQFVVSPDYLAQHGEPSHPSQLQNHRCLTDSSNRLPQRWRYQEDGKEQHVAVQSFCEANDGGIVARLASAGHGIAYLPSFLTEQYVEQGKLVAILSQYQFDSTPVSLVYPAKLMLNPVLKSFVEFLLVDDS